jgi:hypothetical protein
MPDRDLDDRIRQLFERAVQRAPAPAPLPTKPRPAFRSPRRRRLMIGALAATVAVVVAVVVIRSNDSGERVTAPAPSLPSTTAAGAPQRLTPVLAPTDVPATWTATVSVVANGFDISYVGPGVTVEFSVTVPNPPPAVGGRVAQTLSFRGDNAAFFEDWRPADPTSRKMLAWWEPGRWADPMYANSPRSQMVPYFLNAVGVDATQFWAIANSLRPVAAVGAGPAVSVIPATGLHNAQPVQVAVDGFPPDARVRVAECPAEAADLAQAMAKQTGHFTLECGAQQPFVDTGSAGSGTFGFTVHDPTLPVDSAPQPFPCSAGCILVATDGTTYVTAGLGFGTAAPPTPVYPTAGTAATRSLPAGPPATLGVAGPLAVGPNGDLYIADVALDRLLVRAADGTFRVIAGDGHSGFSGDGGPAISAELTNVSDLAAAPDGTLYLVDADRVRTVSTDGTIRTVAGDGKHGPPVTDATPALAASLRPQNTLAIALSPSGELYISTGTQLLRLADGRLYSISAVVGAGPLKGRPLGDLGQIAIDVHGNIDVSGYNGWAIWQVTPAGIATEIGNGEERRSGGDTSVLERAPDGEVSGERGPALETIDGQSLVPGFTFNDSFFLTYFAFAPDGTIYADETAGGVGFEAHQQLVSVTNQHVKVLWQQDTRTTS